MVRISFVVVPKTLYWLKHINIFETVKKSNDKIVQKKFQNMTINLLSYILRVHTLIFLASFFINFVVELFPIVWRVDIVSMFPFFGTDIREKRKHKKRIQTPVNALNDLHYKIKFQNRVNDKQLFYQTKHCFSFLNKDIFYSLRHFLKIPKNLVTLAFLLLGQILKNINMPRQNPRIQEW